METNSGPRRPVPAVCRILCSNVRGMAGNQRDLTMASSRFDILLCCETLVSDMRYESRVGIVGFRIWSPCLVRGPDASGPRADSICPDGCVFRQPKFECGCYKMLIFRVCGVRQNLYVIRLCRNPDLDDRIFYCLLASMSAVQAEDIRACFLFMGDLTGHHQEWLGSTTMNRHGVAAFDFTTVSGCVQLVVGPTHASGGRLDLFP